MDKVSIIVPVYNVPNDMLKKCLESLKRQTYENIEILVIDDGSTDNSKVICDEYKDVNKFKIFHKKNGGLCDTRNFGVEKATGEWITFVDGDDYLNPETIDYIINNKLNNVDIICFGTIKEYKNTKFNYEYNKRLVENKVFDNSKELIEILLDFNSNIGDATAKLYRRSFLNNNKIYHNSSIRQGVEAIDFNIRCFERANGLQFIKFYGYNYAYNPNSVTMTLTDTSLDLLLKGIECLYRDIQNLDYYNSVKNILDCRINYVVVTTVISGVFSKDGKGRYKNGKRLLQKLLKNEYIISAISNDKINIDLKRKIIIMLVKFRFYHLLYIAFILRKIQKNI